MTLDWEIIRYAMPLLLAGLVNTIKISVMAMLLGTVLGFLLGQALRPAIPPLTNELITLAKGSSLLSVISVYELTRAGQAIISVHFVPFEIFMLIALYYYVFLSALAWLSRVLERKLPAW